MSENGKMSLKLASNYYLINTWGKPILSTGIILPQIKSFYIDALGVVLPVLISQNSSLVSSYHWNKNGHVWKRKDTFYKRYGYAEYT